MAREWRSVRIAVDIGGTFTDLQILDARTGAITACKTPTTPEDPSIGLMTGIKEAAAPLRLRAGRCRLSAARHHDRHQCRAGTQAARGVLVTTAGFEDVLEIGRHVRREVYALNPQVPPALIPRDRRIGIAERMRADGSVETAADRAGRSMSSSPRSTGSMPRRSPSAC